MSCSYNRKQDILTLLFTAHDWNVFGVKIIAALQAWVKTNIAFVLSLFIMHFSLYVYILTHTQSN